jgi:two-component system response regulator AtoC
MNKPVKALSASARQKLLAHHWPGNVRELRNALERAVILETTPEIQPESLPDFRVETRLRRGNTPVVDVAAPLDDQLAAYERDLILRVLAQNNFNLTRTAEQLKISRHQLRYRTQRLSIQTGDGAEDESSNPKDPA